MISPNSIAIISPQALRLATRAHIPYGMASRPRHNSMRPYLRATSDKARLAWKGQLILRLTTCGSRVNFGLRLDWASVELLPLRPRLKLSLSFL